MTCAYGHVASLPCGILKTCLQIDTRRRDAVIIEKLIRGKVGISGEKCNIQTVVLLYIAYDTI